MSSNEISLAKVHSVIGQVCVLWAEIDFHLMNMLYLLAQYSSDHYRLERVSAPFDTLLRNMSIREKCEAAVFMFHDVSEDPLIYGQAKKLLITDIAGNLQILRNRIIHDDWVEGDGTVSQIHYRTKIEMPQSHRMVKSVRKEISYETSEQLEALPVQFIEAAEAVSGLYAQLSEIVKRRRG